MLLVLPCSPSPDLSHGTNILDADDELLDDV